MKNRQVSLDRTGREPTNYEHLREASPELMAQVLANIANDACVYCPREREHRCNENCEAGLLEWLNGDYIKDSAVWKEKKNAKKK